MNTVELSTGQVPLSGLRLVEASAGCGKTHALRDLYTRLLVENRLSVADILVVTYTRAATAELRSRIRTHLRSLMQTTKRHDERQHIATGLREFDRAAIFTIHGFCQRVLLENAFESGIGFQTELVEDISPLIEDFVADYWTHELHQADASFLAYLDRVAKLKPRDLANLAKQAIQDPTTPVLPTTHDDIDSEGPHRRWLEALDATGRVWRTDRRSILELLHADRALNRQTYSERWITGTLPATLDELLDGRMLPASTEDIRKVAAGNLRVKQGHSEPRHRFFDACQHLLETDAALRATLRQRTVRFKARFVHRAREGIPASLAGRDRQSFDDLLHHLATVLDGPRGSELARRLRRRFPAALVDEFQDTDPTQYRIVRRIYGDSEAPVFLIGDPKQAIYGFRGADVFAYLQAARESRGDRLTLSTNWRTDPGLIHAVDTVFRGPPEPFILKELTYSGVGPRPGAVDRWLGPPLRFLLARRRDVVDGAREPKRIPKTWDALPNLVASHLSDGLSRRYRDGAPVLPSDHGVLCRTNAQALAVQRALRAVGVTSVLDAGASVFDTEEAEELGRVLRAMIFPYDSRAIRSALATDLLGVRASELARLRTDEASFEPWLHRFLRWGEQWRNEGVLQSFRTLIAEQRLYQQLLALPGGERRLTNFLHLAELLHVAARRNHLGPLALLQWLGQMRRDAEARTELAAESIQMRLESDADAVKLTTIHKSKGLEYGVVYCPYLWEGRLSAGSDNEVVCFHDPTDDFRRKLDLGSEEHARHREWSEHEAFAEAMRLTYVALTRAKHACHIVWGAFSGFEGSALAYLLHQSGERGKDPPASALSPDLARERIKTLTDDAIEKELGHLAGTDRVSVEDLNDRSAAHPPRKPESPPLRSAREWTRGDLSSARTSSFSALTTGSTAEAPFDLGRDRDELAEAFAPQAAPPDTAPSLPLATFPAGPGPGQLVHSVLEQIDFGDPATLRLTVESTLHEYGVSDVHAPALVTALGDALQTPLPSGGTLGDVRCENRLVELEFLLPVGEGGHLTAASIAAVLERHGYPEGDAGYPRVVAQLGFEPLQGFLRGFIDLVYEQNGAYWVADYKTNHLGNSAEDYRPDALLAPMRKHHYHLQGLLYAVAVHRYLRRRVRGWEIDQRWGGVLYLFLRGMGKARGRSGVFAERPSKALLDDLDRLFRQGPR